MKKSILNVAFISIFTMMTAILVSCCSPAKSKGHGYHHKSHHEHSKIHHEHGDK